MSTVKTIHKRRKRRTAKQGSGKSKHKGKSGRTGSMQVKKRMSRRANVTTTGDAT